MVKSHQEKFACHYDGFMPTQSIDGKDWWKPIIKNLLQPSSKANATNLPLSMTSYISEVLEASLLKSYLKMKLKKAEASSQPFLSRQWHEPLQASTKTRLLLAQAWPKMLLMSSCSKCQDFLDIDESLFVREAGDGGNRISTSFNIACSHLIVLIPWRSKSSRRDIFWKMDYYSEDTSIRHPTGA